MSWVYFFRPIGAEGPIKIGYSRQPEERLNQYLAWSPVPLEIVARIPGEKRLEQRIHRAFADDWSHHEWFRGSPALLAMLGEIKAGRFDADTLPKGRPCRVTKPRALAGRRAQSFHMRLYWARKRGVVVPDEVREAGERYSGYWRPRSQGFPPRLPADAKIVEAFLAGLKQAA